MVQVVPLGIFLVYPPRSASVLVISASLGLKPADFTVLGLQQQHLALCRQWRDLFYQGAGCALQLIPAVSKGASPVRQPVLPAEWALCPCPSLEHLQPQVRSSTHVAQRSSVPAHGHSLPCSSEQAGGRNSRKQPSVKHFTCL